MFISSNLIIDLERYIEKSGLAHPFEKDVRAKTVTKPDVGIRWEQAVNVFNVASLIFKNEHDIEGFVRFLLSDESTLGLVPSRFTHKIFSQSLLFDVIFNFVGRNKFPAVEFTTDFRGDSFYINLKTATNLRSTEFLFDILRRFLELLPTTIGATPATVEVTAEKDRYLFKIKLVKEKNLIKRFNRWRKDIACRRQLIGEFLHPEPSDLAEANSSLEETLGQRRIEIRLANDSLSRKIAELEEIESISGSGTWSIDIATKKVTLSRNATRLFGLGAFARETSLAMFTGCMHVDDQSEFNIAYSRLKADKPDLFIELRVVTKDGHRILQQRGKFEGSTVIGSTFDVTNLRKNELRLAQERELAIEASRHKSQFLASMSHEIRSPMTSVLGFAELILNPQTKPEKLPAYVDTIIKNSKSLLAIIDDILDLSKLEAGNLTFNVADFDLKSMIENTIAKVKEFAAEKNVNLICQIEALPISMQTDQIRFTQAIMNTVGNAVKMAMPGDITIKVVPASKGLTTNGIEMIVEDPDSLINPEFFKLLLGPSHSFEPEKQKKKSSISLSLVLAKALVKAMEGDIRGLSENEPLRSGFAVSLFALSEINKTSALPFHETIPSELAITNSSLSQNNILIAEDNRDIQEILSKILQEAGATTEIANNGIECLAMMEKKEFDMVLMDLQMPIMDGFETIERLRKKGYVRPIIVVTAYALNDERERCMKAGCTDFVTKPINSEVLIKTLVRNQS